VKSKLVSRSTSVSRIATGVAVAGMFFLVAAPWWGSIAIERLIGEIMVYVALASLWNLLAGYTGIVSVGQQAYVGLGAYFLIALSLLGGVHPLLAVPVAGVGTAIVALLVARLVFRLHGAYLAIGTWVVSELFRIAVARLSILGGGSGISLPTEIMKTIGENRFWREAIIYWLALALGFAALGLVYILLRSRIGLALTAIRDSETASASLGIRIERVRYAVYVAVAVVTGMVGSLIALQKVRVTPDTAFSVNDWTVFVIFIVVIGGIGTIEGPIIGTLIYFILREFLADLGSIYLLILGALAIVMMLVAPKGIWGFVKERLGLTIFPTGYRVVSED
jgi:branched-chain amino acid transport system permease protein